MTHYYGHEFGDPLLWNDIQIGDLSDDVQADFQIRGKHESQHGQVGQDLQSVQKGPEALHGSSQDEYEDEIHYDCCLHAALE